MENHTAKLNHIFVTITKILMEVQNVTFKLAALQNLIVCYMQACKSYKKYKQNLN